MSSSSNSPHKLNKSSQISESSKSQTSHVSSANTSLTDATSTAGSTSSNTPRDYGRMRQEEALGGIGSWSETYDGAAQKQDFVIEGW
ncbi:hypothetical protein HYFRA_00013882 [Hymenoscyphus fraxineus]|uniref:Uncharacterized protein n=1 Tax=Hymenoscyphus fraxineus TaxID=746836 RepID=A0A9N9Q158_9HELO|nr:hypothetical protein HYFRA_00013882 [Hymenoscyphus fraxineus]